ncbi:hypothetical protein [Kribbella orskensis]|nr:hypothetical protein [Kribbella orskensis]
MQVMSEAATGNLQVKALVYIAAFAPAEGESALELANKCPGSTLGGTLQSTPLGDGSNDLSIQPAKYRGQFAADVCEPAHTKVVVEVPGASHAVAVSQPDKVADLIERASSSYPVFKGPATL